MVPTALFSSFGEDDYNQDDSGDDSDSEEQSEAKEEPPAVEEKKDEQAELAASLQQTLKEALKAAGNTRLMQQKRRQASPPQPPPPTSQAATANANAFLAPFLLSGGANANSLLIGNSAKGDEPGSQNPLLSFPFQFNFQQRTMAAVDCRVTERNADAELDADLLTMNTNRVSLGNIPEDFISFILKKPATPPPSTPQNETESTSDQSAPQS
ncbi:unnamed protein product [Haemonchus placei]|uniref:Uncharacterized protein n=1 Tax=Haemonchus placei TaxID=6290 RepID=A0A0N4W711_HAEPC|nr:unnamed protein product [Haemonchus placei]